MAVAIIADVGGATSNSYVTLAEADTYFASRLYTTDWDNASVDDKSKALITATARIDQEKFYGERETSTQALAFPRTGLGYLDGIYLDGIIPTQLKEATYELAKYMLSVDMSKPSVDTGTQKKVKVGSIEVEYAIDKNDNVSQSFDTLPPFVMALLGDISRTVSNSGFIEVSR